MPPFKVHAEFEPAGDQPAAVEDLAQGVLAGEDYLTLLGATGTGKTFTIAGVIERVQKPTLVIAPNKSLGAQLANEFREMFPHNAVEYFVSYYDYYQPEAYVPQTDTYIEKDSSINDEIERLRHSATHYVTPEDELQRAIGGIEQELETQLKGLNAQNKLLEAQRLRMRTNYDLEMLREVGFCSGIENYSRHLDGRSPGQPPYTLLDYFPDDWLCVIDESHVTVPQIHGMYEGDMSRKRTLVEFGFRLPSAMDNRPLKFDEFTERVNQAVFMSATPGLYELQTGKQVVEQIVRPTGLVDPEVEVRPTK